MLMLIISVHRVLRDSTGIGLVNVKTSVFDSLATMKINYLDYAYVE